MIKVTYVKIKNVLGVEEREINPGEITVIEDKNGTGKSSAIKAIQNVIGGGSLAELKNVHSDEPAEIVLHMDENGTDVIVKKTETKLSVKKQVDDTAAYEDQSSPQRYLNSLHDGKMSNPVLFLTAKPKERVNMILESIDLPYSETELWNRTGLDRDCFGPVPDGVHPLHALDMHRQNIFNERTGVNRDAKQKNSAAEQMFRSVPKETPDFDGLDKLKKELSETVNTRHFKYNEMEKKRDLQIHQISERAQGEIHELSDSVKDKLNALRMEIHKIENETHLKISDIRKNEALELGGCKEMFSNELDKLSSLFSDKIGGLKEEIASLETAKENAIKIDTVKRQAEEFKSQAVELEENSEVLTIALKELDKYKAELCENLPIDGLEFVEGKMHIHGVPWEQVNSAKQVEIAVKIATLRSQNQQLPIVFIDGAECLDRDNFEMLKTELKNQKVQAFIARVKR